MVPVSLEQPIQKRDQAYQDQSGENPFGDGHRFRLWRSDLSACSGYDNVAKTQPQQHARVNVAMDRTSTGPVVVRAGRRDRGPPPLRFSVIPELANLPSANAV